MQKFTLVIKLGNDAMQTADDIAEALERVAKKVREIPTMQDFDGPIMDLNGNKVGVWGID